MPFQMEKSKSRVPGPSPSFAADSKQVLAEVGFEQTLIDDLIDAGVVISR